MAVQDLYLASKLGYGASFSISDGGAANLKIQRIDLPDGVRSGLLMLQPTASFRIRQGSRAVAAAATANNSTLLLPGRYYGVTIDVSDRWFGTFGPDGGAGVIVGIVGVTLVSSVKSWSGLFNDTP